MMFYKFLCPDGLPAAMSRTGILCSMVKCYFVFKYPRKLSFRFLNDSFNNFSVYMALTSVSNATTATDWTATMSVSNRFANAQTESPEFTVKTKTVSNARNATTDTRFVRQAWLAKKCARASASKWRLVENLETLARVKPCAIKNTQDQQAPKLKK